jgi:hypothetical protein
MAKKTYTITFEGDDQSIADRAGKVATFVANEFDPEGVTFAEADYSSGDTCKQAA